MFENEEDERTLAAHHARWREGERVAGGKEERVKRKIVKKR
jgi:hypothetical protein